MVTIDEMKANGVQLGSKLEITLLEGAEFNNDAGPGGNDPVGFVPADKMTDHPGLLFIGYVSNFDKKTSVKRIFLNRGWMPSDGRPAYAWEGGSRLYFQQETIHSYKKG